MATPKTPPAKEILTNQKKFGTPVVVIGTTQVGKKKITITTDDAIARMLEQRKKRSLDQSLAAQLDLATAQDEKEITRLRLEQQKMVTEGRPPEEEENVSKEKAAEDAAEVAATAVANGVDPEDAKDLARGKSKVVVVGARNSQSTGWIVVNGTPMQDEDGQYTFSQALQVAALQKKPESEAGNELKTLIEEIRRQNETRNSEALKSIVDSQKALAEEIKNIKNGNGAKQSETVAAHAPPAKVRIFIQDPKSPTGVHVQELAPGESWFVPARTDVPSGEDLEHIREKNRHDERLAEIGDKKNQEAEEKAAKLEGRRFAGEIVENVLNVGTALIAEATGKQAPSLKSKSPPSQQTIEYLKCSCDFDVPVPPGGAVATCPKCNKTVFKCPQCKSGIFAVDSSASEAVCPSCGYKMINEAVTPSSKAAQPPPTPGPAPAGPAAQSSQTGG